MPVKQALNGFYVLGGGVFIKRVGDELEIELHRHFKDDYNSRQGSVSVPISRLLDLVKELDPVAVRTDVVPVEPVSSADMKELRRFREQKIEREERKQAQAVKDAADKKLGAQLGAVKVVWTTAEEKAAYDRQKYSAKKTAEEKAEEALVPKPPAGKNSTDGHVSDPEPEPEETLAPKKSVRKPRKFTPTR